MPVFPLKPCGAGRPDVIGLQARALLPLRTKTLDFLPVEFLVDTGASISQMGLIQAQSLGLPVPEHSQTVRMATAAGRVEKRGRLGWILVKFSDMADMAAWDCWFFEDWPEGTPPLLGLGGRVLHNISLRFASRSNEYPNGFLSVEYAIPSPEAQSPR